MSSQLAIAVDLMGGDLGPRSTLPSALSFAANHPDVQLLLAAPAREIPSQLPSNVIPLPAEDVVDMSVRPAQALRHGSGSSMWKSIEAVASQRAQACVSAGNTGALVAIGKHLLDTFEGVDRPAICKAVPTQRGTSLVLDLGANIECSAEQLQQFALMGSVLASCYGLQKPTVGLLNIGAEDIKGSEEIQQAARLLEAHSALNYQGYVEGDDIFAGTVDVVVCDGFVGNVALKVGEGMARLLRHSMRQTVQDGWRSRLAGYFAMPLLRKWHTQFDPSRYNGASLLGLQGVVVKSHGSADSAGFSNALSSALEQAQHQIPQKISQGLSDNLP